MADDIQADPKPSKPSLRSRFTRSRVATGLQVAGGAAVSVAAFEFNTLAGWLTVGGGLVVAGIVVERGGT